MISEINYNPYAPTAAELAENSLLDSDDFEFLEIYNPGPGVADLVGVALTDGVEFDFYGSAITTLQPGAYALVVSNQDAFELRYGTDLPVAGQYTGNLNNAGEDIDVVDGTGTVIFTVMYGDGDPWPVRAMDRGPRWNWSTRETRHWRCSPSGTAGAAAASMAARPAVRVRDRWAW